ncbi:MAG: zf-HC2 domain-containing protein [candidate division Zixibacteria bacterium]|nr:zf-HC2 domain-containing protein [candidate division Zixibacteria bacterium]
MSECKDRRFREMLHLYELGQLSPEQLEELEVHLLECDACFEEIQQFDRTVLHLRHSDKIRAAIAQLAETKSELPEVTPTGKKLWTTWLPVSLAALIFILLILKDWQFDIHPTQEALAVENRLAVMYFENKVDVEDNLRLGEMITSLLITDLSESRLLQVVSSQHLYDLLKTETEGKPRPVDRDIATRLARKARARWMLVGEILQTEPSLVVTSQIIDLATGNVMASQKISQAAIGDIFFLVDSLTVEIKKDLAPSETAQPDTDRMVAEVTTRSPEAYRLYLEGLEYYYKFYYNEAINAFEQALAHDSTMAMAYYYLARLKDGSMIDKAVQYADKASRKEKLYIESLNDLKNNEREQAIAKLSQLTQQYPNEKDAFYLLGLYNFRLFKFDQAVAYMDSALAVDSFFKPAYNLLATTYYETDNLEKAVWAINRYISLAPDEANPYETRGKIYANFNKIDPAIESFRKALQVKPDFYSSLLPLGNMYLYKGEYRLAESCYTALTETDNRNYRSHGRVYLSYIPIHQGKLSYSLELIDSLVAADSAETQTRTSLSNTVILNFFKARIYVELNNYSKARETMDKVLTLSAGLSEHSQFLNRAYNIQILAESGLIAEAKREAEQLKNDLEKTETDPSMYRYASGCIYLAEHNPEKAVVEFESAVRTMNDFPTRFQLGRAYLEAGMLARAVEEFERQSEAYSLWRLCWGIWNAELHYYLGTAYENSRWYDRAAEQYRIFIEMWRDGDKGLAILEDARARLTRLNSRP